MYVTYAYYTGTYNGTQFPEKEDFQKAEREAETYIRYLTYLNGDIFVDKAHTDGIKTAVCAAAEARDNAVREIAEGGNVKSESKDGFSASFVTTRRDGETVDDYITLYVSGGQAPFASYRMAFEKGGVRTCSRI